MPTNLLDQPRHQILALLPMDALERYFKTGGLLTIGGLHNGAKLVNITIDTETASIAIIAEHGTFPLTFPGEPLTRVILTVELAD